MRCKQVDKQMTKFIEYTKGIYSKNMTLVIGKKHTYVGMDIEIKMPAGNHLFKVNNTCVKLCKRNKITFHRLLKKPLFLSKHAQPDIQPTITFLTPRVRNTDKDDWKKIQRVLSYLDKIINSVNIHLKVNNLNVVHW